MAWYEIDIFESCIEVDLHKYTHSTAIGVIHEKTKEAYEHGFRYIKFIHGNGGSIKSALRSMLKRNELSTWIQDKTSPTHKIKEATITFALKKNPNPSDKEWKELPTWEY